MTPSPLSQPNSTLKKVLLVTGIILVALNMRPALASIGPLIPVIRQHTGLSDSVLGLLTTIPLLAFGILSTVTPVFTRRWGIEDVIAGALVILSAGIFLRVIHSPWFLFGGTVLIGIAIAIGNVLLPAIVKRDFSNHTGLMTSIYSGMLSLGAAIAAGVSVPLANKVGWHWALGLWGVLSLLALIVWLPQITNSTLPQSTGSFIHALKDLAGSSMAWKIATFMGLQSLTFYVILAWLPDLLQDAGIQADTAGWMLSLSQLMGVAGTLGIPIWAEKTTDQRKVVWVLIVLEIVSLIGLMLPEVDFVWVLVSVIGFTLGGSFGLSLLFIVLRAQDTETTTELSGMVQSIGYLLAATGPALFGAFHEITHDWFVPLLFLLAVAVMKLFAGLGAGRPVEI